MQCNICLSFLAKFMLENHAIVTTGEEQKEKDESHSLAFIERNSTKQDERQTMYAKFPIAWIRNCTCYAKEYKAANKWNPRSGEAQTAPQWHDIWKNIYLNRLDQYLAMIKVARGINKTQKSEKFRRQNSRILYPALMWVKLLAQSPSLSHPIGSWKILVQPWPL